MEQVSPITGAVGVEHDTRLAIIRNVAAAQSSRFFKREKNTQDYAALVFMVIQAEIYLALYLAGVPMRDLMGAIDTSSVVIPIMVKDGYDWGDTTIYQVDDPSGVSPPAGQDREVSNEQDAHVPH